MSKYYLLTFNENWADEHDVPALEVMNEEEFKKWSKTKLYPDANLGNSGDYFMEDEKGLTGAEYIKQGTVSKFVVDESFVKIFKKADLNYLSLCNIFNIDEQYNEDEEDDEE